MVTTVTTPVGVWRHVCDVAQALGDRGHDVRLVVPEHAVELRRQAVQSELAVLERVRFDRGAVCHFHAADTYDRALMLLMVRARVRGAAVVVTEHLPRTDASDTTLTDDRRRPGAWVAKTLFKTLQFALCHATIAVSASSARFLALRYGRAIAEIDMVRNGVARSPVEVSKVAGMAPALVCTAGAMLRQKGFDVLLRAVAASGGSWRLALAGDGPHLVALRALAARLEIDDRVAFLGWQDAARAVFADARVVVVPSRWEAAAPYVVLEAMAEGRPVVATRFPGVEEVVVDGDTGVLVPVDDHLALAAALDDLVDDPDRCSALGTAGRERLDAIPGLSVTEMVDGLVAIYERVARR